MKRTNRKPNVAVFLIDIELYYNPLVRLQNKKATTISKTYKMDYVINDY